MITEKRLRWKQFEDYVVAQIAFLKVLINIFGKMYNCHILIFSWLFFNIIVLPDHNITATEDEEGKIGYYFPIVLSTFNNDCLLNMKKYFIYLCSSASIHQQRLVLQK